jgi:D-serine deaminase-like pyridoxal phosphate-dependent protein
MTDLDTPVVTVDLDIVDRNIDRMQRYCDEHGIALRAHVKTHKTAAIARLQLAAGAVGLACQKLGEAEAVGYVSTDVLVTFPLVGAPKTKRLASLATRMKVAVAADSEACVRGLSAALADAGAEAALLVDCDTGFGRTGVQTPAAAADLAELIEQLPSLHFDGLFTHPTPPDGIWLAAARRELLRRGLEMGRISVGGTARAFLTHELSEVTELRVGTYVYGDRACLANGTATADDCALRVHSTVVSRPTRDRAVLDAGSKTLTSDRAAGCDPDTMGLVVEYPEARVARLYEEHAVVELHDANGRPEVGEVVTIIPNHACGVVNLHDQVEVHRGGVSQGTWAIDARGRSR